MRRTLLTIAATMAVTVFMVGPACLVSLVTG
jgi:hypothetical protein